MLDHPMIEICDGLRDFLAASALEPMEVDDDGIVQSACAPIAEHAIALADGLLHRHVVECDVFHFTRQHQRTHLQYAELRGTFGTPRKSHGKFNLDRPTQGFFADRAQFLKNGGERKYTVL